MINMNTKLLVTNIFVDFVQHKINLQFLSKLQHFKLFSSYLFFKCSDHRASVLQLKVDGDRDSAYKLEFVINKVCRVNKKSHQKQ